MKDLVVVIPGILGSVLRKDDRVLWGFEPGLLATALFTRGGFLRKHLSLPGDSPTEPDIDGVTASGLLPDLHLLPGLWKVDGYGLIAQRLQETFDLAPGRNYQEFAYDWRRDNRFNARVLADKITGWLTHWRTESPDARVVILAHSMGGLVARYFLEVLQGWKTGDVRALITWGTPFRGSLNALDMLANGLKMGPIDLTSMGRTFTSVYQLLPIYPAYDPGNGVLVRIGEASGICNVDPAMAADALAFHHEIRDAVTANRNEPQWFARGYRLYPIVGREQPTLQTGIAGAGSVLMSDTYRGVDLRGDGTVPRVSAIPLEFDDTSTRGDMYAATKHGSLQNADAVFTHVVGRINDLFTDFGGFRATRPSGAEASLALADLARSDEPITAKVQADSEMPLTAELWAAGADAPLQRREISVGPEDWTSVAFEPVAAGNYRVRVAGTRLSAAAEDSIGVADAGPATAADGDGARRG